MGSGEHGAREGTAAARAGVNSGGRDEAAGFLVDLDDCAFHAAADELVVGGGYFRKRDPERQTKRLIAQLERLGLPSELGDTSSLACAGAIAPEGSRDRVGGPIQERPDPRNELKQGS
jgi:hypothetical protein